MGGERAFVYFARILFCSLKNAFQHSLAKFSPGKFLPGEHFVKEYGRALVRDQESVLSKMLSHIPLTMPLGILLFKKSIFSRDHFTGGCRRAFLERKKGTTFCHSSRCPTKKAKKV